MPLPAFPGGLLDDYLAGVEGELDAPLFVTASGTLVRHGLFYRRVFVPAARAALPELTKRAGQRAIVAGRDPKKASPIRWHDVRHTCASFSVAQEPNLFKVMKLLGHKDIQTTINRYSHLLPEEAASVAEGLDATWRAADPVS